MNSVVAVSVRSPFVKCGYTLGGNDVGIAHTAAFFSGQLYVTECIDVVYESLLCRGRLHHISLDASRESGFCAIDIRSAYYIIYGFKYSVPLIGIGVAQFKRKVCSQTDGYRLFVAGEERVLNPLDVSSAYANCSLSISFTCIISLSPRPERFTRMIFPFISSGFIFLR